MTIELSKKHLVSALVVYLLGAAGLLCCFAAYLHMKRVAGSDLLAQQLQKPGDAPLPVQAGVRNALKDFQDGYTQRDPRNLDAFMSRLFGKNDDILILGTGGAEWARGYPAAAEFIKADWKGWGDLRLGVENALICSSGDVAWVTSTGTVQKKGIERPVRFSAILTRNDGIWHFRQVHFQWEGHGASPANLLLMKK
jgi:hypothetical protein